MKLTTTIIIISLTFFAGCTNDADKSTAATTKNCRSYPKTYTYESNTYACTWTTSTLKFVCTGGGNTYTYTYPSLKKFVDEVDIMGKPAFTTIAITGSSTSTGTYTYDATSRFTKEDFVSGALAWRYVYSTHDTSGRPTAGTYTLDGSCSNAIVGLTYNATQRTGTRTVSGGTGVACVDISTLTTFDAATGIDRIVASTTSGGTTTYTKVISATAEVCE